MDAGLRATARVETMLDRGESFEQIEEFINRAFGLGEDARSALWLYAWAETSRDDRRRVVTSLIRQRSRQARGT
jgi:hypothetical protein